MKARRGTPPRLRQLIGKRVVWADVSSGNFLVRLEGGWMLTARCAPEWSSGAIRQTRAQALVGMEFRGLDENGVLLFGDDFEFQLTDLGARTTPGMPRLWWLR
jgi:hypothetical protein